MTRDDLAARLHAEHVKEFTFLAGDKLSDPMTVEQCGNCQRWARYALITQLSAELDAFVLGVHAVVMSLEGCSGEEGSKVVQQYRELVDNHNKEKSDDQS